VILRPGAADEERHTVLGNTANRITLTDTFAAPPRDGDRYRLVRVERFEPEPADPIDPSQFDPDNPQNEANRDLRNFLSFDEVDEHGRVRDLNGDGKTRYSALEKVPSRSILRLRFSEPVDPMSVRPWESFRVGDAESDGHEVMGTVSVGDHGRLACYHPALMRGCAAPVYHGFLPSSQEVREASVPFTLRVVPDEGFVRQRLSRDQLARWRQQGYRGVTSLAGHAIGFASLDFETSLGYVDYRCDFVAVSAPDEDEPDIGGIVHLFRGAPVTGQDPASGEVGVRYQDRAELYGPHIADLNLFASGFLSGAPVKFFQRVLDESEPPPDSAFAAWSVGAASPFESVGGLGGRFGARFQHIYRDVEASADVKDLRGTVSDLWRVAWAPIGGHVADALYENISIRAAHSDVVPNTTQTAGVPTYPYSGIGPAFDRETFETGGCGARQDRSNSIGPLEVAVPPGTRYFVTQNNLFTPPNSPFPYQPWPEFTRPFKYDNEHSLLLEYRIWPQSSPQSIRNGFTYSPSSYSASVPLFRVLSGGDQANPLAPDNLNDRRARCADFGDNSRYLTVFDYAKLTSRIQSSFIGVVGTTQPDYLQPIFVPSLAEQPAGTRVRAEFQGSRDPHGFGEVSTWTTNIDDLDLAWPFVRFRLTLEADRETRLTPVFDTIVIPYRR
jgi:hypothetical protein